MNKKSTLSILLVFICSACTKEQEQIEMPVRSVKVMEIDSDNLVGARTLSGTVESSQKSAISFRVAGQIKDLLVDVGDKVETGDTLAILENREYELAVQSAQAQLNSTRTAFTEKKDELERQVTLNEKGFVAQTAVEKAENAYKVALSDIDVAEANLETAQNNLMFSHLKAPYSGYIAARSQEAFSEIAAGQMLFEIQRENALDVNILMPESMINQIRFGDIVNVSFPSLEGFSSAASITEIGTEATVANAYLISARLTSDDDRIRSGMTARATFASGLQTDAESHLIPLAALDTRIPGTFDETKPLITSVFVVENGIATKRKVQIADVVGNQLQVTSGLTAGEKLIIAGVSFIDEGQQVKMWEPTYNLPAVINQ